MGWDSNCTLKHGERFAGGRQTVYEESIVGAGGFAFVFSLPVLLFGKARYNFETALTLILSRFP